LEKKKYVMQAIRNSIFVLITMIGFNVFGQTAPSGSPYFLLDVESGISFSEHDFGLEGSNVKVDIAGIIADVTVEQVYVNNSDQELDAQYVFPGSTQSAVYAMEMQVGDRIIEAKIKEKHQAKKIFNKAKKQGKTASLMDQERPNVFKMSLANIKTGDTIKVRFSYTETIIPKNKEYEFIFPTIVGPRYASAEHVTNDPWVSNPYTDTEHLANSILDPYFNIEVDLNAGLPIQKAVCNSHPYSKVKFKSESAVGFKLTDEQYEKDKGDVIFSYRLAGEKVNGGMLLYDHGGEQFFMMTMQPPARPKAEDIPPRDYLFVVDVSGSMNGFPIQISKNLIKDLLFNLRPIDRFNVMLFASGFSKYSNTMVPVSDHAIAQAMMYIDNQPGSGGTEILPALKESLAMIDDNGRSTTVVIATDGLVTVEKEAMELIEKNLGEANFFPFGIGRSVNRLIIEAMAHVGHSEPMVCTTRKEAKRIAQEFRKMISSPVLTNVKFDFDGLDVYDVVPKSVPDLFADKPIVVYGKYRGKPNGKVRVTGNSGTGLFEQEMAFSEWDVSQANRGLRYLWARQKIKLLSDYHRVTYSGKEKREIIALGLKYNLLTEFTSFVGVDEGRPEKADVDSGSVPEPHEWGLIFIGIGLLGFLLATNRGLFGA
jgi:Ca-activated chloride channel family protein